jgi:hypothetical protein
MGVWKEAARREDTAGSINQGSFCDRRWRSSESKMGLAAGIASLLSVIEMVGRCFFWNHGMYSMSSLMESQSSSAR